MSEAASNLSPGLRAMIERIQADPSSTRSAPTRRRPDAMVTPGLELPRAFIVPRGVQAEPDRLERFNFAWWTVLGLGVLGAFALARGND